MHTFRLIVKTFKDYYGEIFHFLLMVLLLLVSTALVLPGPFALAGLWYVAQQSLHGENTGWHAYWEGVKRYGLRTWGVVLITLFGYLLLVVNLWFYNNPQVSPLSQDVAFWVSGIWIVIAFLWSGVVLYFEAFLLEQEDSSILLALRNSFYLAMLHPINTFLWVLFTLLLLGLSVVMPPLILVTPALIALLSLNGVRALVEPILAAREGEERDNSGDGKNS